MTADDEQVLDGIEEVARRHLGWQGRLDPSAPITDALALDSLRRLTLVVEIENRFRVCLEDEDEAAIETAGDLVRVIRRRMGEGTGGQ